MITGCEKMEILEQALRVGRNFQPLDETARLALLDRTRKKGSDGQLEGFKTTEEFDATSRNEHWLTTGEL